MLKIKFKKFLFFLFLVFLIFLFSEFVLAKEKEPGGLEVEYPEIGGWRPTVIKEITEKEFAEYIKYIFNIAIFLSGLVAFGVIVYGGIRYLTSAGSPAAIKDAKSYITGGILGLIFLFSSYLILTTINPQLVILRIEKPEFKEIKFEKPGVYLFANNEWGFYGLSQDNLEDFSNKVEKIKIVNPETGDYKIGAILHEDTDCRKSCQIFFESKEVQKEVSSLTVFRQVEKHYGYVEVCSKADGEGVCRRYYEPQEEDFPDYLEEEVRSINITGNYLVVLFGRDPDPKETKKQCAVFESSVPDLKNHPMNKCDPERVGYLYTTFTPCASKIAIYPVIGEAPSPQTPTCECIVITGLTGEICRCKTGKECPPGYTTQCTGSPPNCGCKCIATP